MSQKVKGKDTHPTMGVINIGENSMKKQILKTLTKEKYVITCKLADECGNGVEHFSITYDMYKKGRNGHWYKRGGGCGSDLYKEFGELELICKLHLSLFNGVPFYAVKNGMYHIEHGDIDSAKGLLRVTDKEMEVLRYINNPIDFKCALIDMGIAKRWKEEADECIAWLSGSDEPFVSKAGDKYDFKVSDVEMDSYLDKKKNGVYSKENYEKEREDNLTKMVNIAFEQDSETYRMNYKRYMENAEKEKTLRLKMVEHRNEFKAVEYLFKKFYFNNGELDFFGDVDIEDKEKIIELAKEI